MNEDRVKRAAAWLHETRTARRKLMPLPKELRPGGPLHHAVGDDKRVLALPDDLKSR